MKKELIILFIALICINFVFAVDCPRGLINDSYPGKCGLYTDENSNKICDLSEVKENTSFNEKTERYYLFEISFILTLIYLASYILSKKNFFSVVLHKRIWNILLLLSFIITALTAILFLLKIDYGLEIINFNLYFWHNEAGIIMILISIYHIFWHWNYFKSLIK